MSDTPLVIRTAVPNDAQTLLGMINAMAAADQSPALEPMSQHRLIRDLFEKKYFEVVIAEWQGTVAGYAAYSQGYSTFEARPTLYIDDLYVKNEFRGRHVAFEVFRFLLGEAKKRECGRMEWDVLESNKDAFSFYERLSAKRLQGWIHFRLNFDDIQRLA